uniref:Uncharacterized protein n=1 Tax=Citrobacter freundii TaxID=546 RepID=A0A3S5I467_CITFR|nr:hypothetical protein [Citrobacter freundii]
MRKNLSKNPQSPLANILGFQWLVAGVFSKQNVLTHTTYHNTFNGVSPH